MREFLEVERDAQTVAEVQVPIAGRHATLLPVRPAGVFFDGGPKLFGRKGEPLGEAELRLANIHPDEDATNVKNDGANFRWSHVTCSPAPGPLRYALPGLVPSAMNAGC